MLLSKLVLSPQLFSCRGVLRCRAADCSGFSSHVVTHSPSWMHCRASTAGKQWPDFYFFSGSATGLFTGQLNLWVPTCWRWAHKGYCGQSLAWKDVCLRWWQCGSRSSIAVKGQECVFLQLTFPHSSFSSYELSAFDLESNYMVNMELRNKNFAQLFSKINCLNSSSHNETRAWHEPWCPKLLLSYNGKNLWHILGVLGSAMLSKCQLKISLSTDIKFLLAWVD